MASPLTHTRRLVNATGGVDPKTYSITSGALPSGLTLNASTGEITGTPVASGTFNFTVQVQDSASTPNIASASYSLVVADPAEFERVWNGANGNWSDPANWLPNGVPSPTDDVLIAGPASVALTADVTVQSLVLLNGATLDTAGFTITITGDVQAGNTITGAGTLMLTGSGTLSGTVSNLHIAAGASITLTGPVHATGNFIHEGALLLAGFPLTVDGLLIVPSGLPITPGIVGDGAAVTVGGLDVASLVLDDAPLVMNGGTFVRFDNVAFQNFLPNVTPFTIAHPGDPLPWMFGNVSFNEEPTTGFYIDATDTSADANLLTIQLVNAQAANGPSHTSTTNGAVVNWVTGLADLLVTKDDSADPVPVNGGVTYTINVTNLGPDTAVGVQAVDTLLPSALFVSATSGCTELGGTVTCALGDLVAGGSTSVTITVQPTSNGVLTNTVNVFSSTADDDLSNNQAVQQTTVTPAANLPDLSVTKTHAPSVPVVGQPLTYTVTVTNNGPASATTVTLVDTLPADVIFGSVNSPMCQESAGVIICDFGNMASAVSIGVQITVTPTVSKVYVNTANVSANEVDPIPPTTWRRTRCSSPPTARARPPPSPVRAITRPAVSRRGPWSLATSTRTGSWTSSRPSRPTTRSR